jgi:hypothetical protein
MELLHSLEAILCYQHGYLVLESTAKNRKTPYSEVQDSKLYRINIVGDYNRKKHIVVRLLTKRYASVVYINTPQTVRTKISIGFAKYLTSQIDYSAYMRERERRIVRLVKTFTT